jgi:hypothetical protein
LLTPSSLPLPLINTRGGPGEKGMKKDGEIIERREQTDEKNREKIERGLEG